jgi:hypothetical protein
MTKFQPHGEFHVYAEEHMLISKVKGPFNVEFTNTYCKAVAPIARTIAASGPWGSIVEYRVSALFPLESAGILREQAEIGATRMQMIAVCWVIAPTVEGYGLINRQAGDIYAGLCTFEIFERDSDARAWLSQQLQRKNTP